MQRQIITVLAILCAFLVTSQAQTPSPSPAPVPRMRGSEKRAAQATISGNNTAAKANPDAVGMDQPVITLKGACQATAEAAPSKDCISTITRAQFEKLVDALQPGMAAEAKHGFATNYARLLIYSDAARALNLQNDPGVQQIIQFITNQALAEGVRRHYAAEFAHPSDQQIQDYYNQNSNRYLEATLQRIIIPTNPGTSDTPKPSEAEIAATAEKMRQRWLAGEDPVKIQQAAFDAVGIKGASTPEIDIGARRPGSLPVDQEGVFQLKAGEISKPYSDPAAMYLYKVVSIRQIPLGEVKDSIIKILQQQHLQNKLEAIGRSATPELNEEYFGPAPSAGSPVPGGHPGAEPQSSNPPK